ncbi:MAG: FMN-binding protein [Bullifex sp.]
MKKLISCIAAVFIIMAVSCSFMMGSSEKTLDEIPVTELSRVKDGVFRGSAETPLVKAEVSVSVKDHVITEIELIRHECGKGKPAEAMLSEMMRLNTSESDLVSGATASSKVIRAAVRNALLKGSITE